MYVKDTAQLRELCEEARALGRIGLDAEFIRERTFFPKLALIQIAAGDTIALVDPLGEVDLAPVEELLVDESVVKVLHAGSQDLEIFFYRTQQTPCRIFDTQIAAAMLGIGNQISYGGLVDKVLGTTLVKGESFTDWLRRPLSPKQESYALDDVRYLFPLHDALQEKLTALGRSSWVVEECERYDQLSQYVQPEETLYTRVKRFGTLSPRGQVVLRELAIWRDQEARTRDRPRRSVIADEALVEIARTQPKAVDALAGIRALHPREREKSGDGLIRAVTRGMAVPRADLPEERKRRAFSDDAKLVVDFLGAFLKAECQRAEISPNMVTNSAGLQALVRGFFESRSESSSADDIELSGIELPLLDGWRGDLIGKKLLGFLRGEVSVYLDPVECRPVLEDRALN